MLDLKSQMHASNDAISNMVHEDLLEVLEKLPEVTVVFLFYMQLKVINTKKLQNN